MWWMAVRRAVDLAPPRDRATESESPDNLIDVSQLGAVEVYSAAERPPGYGTMQGAPPPPPPDTGRRPGNAPAGSSTGQLTTPGAQNNQSYLPSQPCRLILVWTRAHLALPDPSTITTPAVSTQKTAPHDMTHGLPSFPSDASCTTQAAADTIDLLIYASVQGTPPRAMSDADWSAYKDQVLAGLLRWTDLPSELLLPRFHSRRSAGPRMASRQSIRAARGTSHRRSRRSCSSCSTRRERSRTCTWQHPPCQAAPTRARLAMVEQAAAGHAFPRLPGSTTGSDSVPLYLIVESSEAHRSHAGGSTRPARGTRVATHAACAFRSGLPKSDHRHGAPTRQSYGHDGRRLQRQRSQRYGAIRSDRPNRCGAAGRNRGPRPSGATSVAVRAGLDRLVSREHGRHGILCHGGYGWLGARGW